MTVFPSFSTNECSCLKDLNLPFSISSTKQPKFAPCKSKKKTSDHYLEINCEIFLLPKMTNLFMVIKHMNGCGANALTVLMI